jgi:hypothetical protein
MGFPVDISKVTVVPGGPQNFKSSEYVRKATEPVATDIAVE